jgi:hypothetical protein
MTMSTLARIVAVEHLGDHRLQLTFSDGLVRELDFDGMLDGGVLEKLNDVRFFGTVTVDQVAGTIAWPNGVDLDPDVLHGDFESARGSSAKLIREYYVNAAG